MIAWSPVAVQTLQYIPKPNTILNGGPGFETSAYNANLRDDKGGIRIDTPTHFGALFGYYFQDQYTYQNPYDQGTNIPGFTDANVGITSMVNLGLTTTFSPRLVNDARLAYLRDCESHRTAGGGARYGRFPSLAGLQHPVE